MTLDMKRSFKKKDYILYKESGGKSAIVDPYRRTLLYLNPTACHIWKLIDGKNCLDAIVADLEASFDIDARMLRRDAINFICDLIKREVIS